jgi:hypothetical protein
MVIIVKLDASSGPGFSSLQPWLRQLLLPVLRCVRCVAALRAATTVCQAVLYTCQAAVVVRTCVIYVRTSVLCSFEPASPVSMHAMVDVLVWLNRPHLWLHLCVARFTAASCVLGMRLWPAQPFCLEPNLDLAGLGGGQQTEFGQRYWNRRHGRAAYMSRTEQRRAWLDARSDKVH